jgi:subtilisin family serine protease
MKKNHVKQEFATAILTVLLFTSMFPMLNVHGASVSQQISLNQNSHLTPQEKIDQYLRDQMQNSTSRNELFRVLIKYSSNMKSALPKGIKILKEFKLIPLVSAVASSFEIGELAKLEGVEYIYPDLKLQALNFSPKQQLNLNCPKISDLQNIPSVTQAIPQTPWFGEYPCFLNESTALIRANELWAEGITGKGVVIAILDTGINKYHPDLDDMDDNPVTCDPKVLGEIALIEEPSWEVDDPMDYHGHGTHCASIAAGTGGTGAMGYLGTFFEYNYFNGTILPETERGVAPSAYLYNVKVLNSEGYGYDSWVIAGVEWAVEHGADVISMSLGGWPALLPEEDPLVLALDIAIDHGVVCVVAAGNDGWGYFTLGTPGFASKVITVGATTETDELAFFSSRGPEEYGLHAKPDILAPGTCVVAAFAGFDLFEEVFGVQVFYWELSGTSMAAPHVAGAAALLLQAFPGASPYAVKSAMMLSAKDLGLDPMAQGTGRLDVAKAYEVMTLAPKESWSAPMSTNSILPASLTLKPTPNLTDVTVLVEDSFCSPWKMEAFLTMLIWAGATVTSGTGPYSNDTLVDPGSGKPLYDIFVLSEPYVVNEAMLPPSVLAYYVQQNGTVLFTGDSPIICRDYANWTRQWGISWDNTAVGGLSTNIASHAVTNGITEIFFGSPIASLILRPSVTPSPKCVVWDPVFPGVAVWEAQAPSTGKVVILSDDGILADQYLSVADNLALGFNIIKWFTKPPDMFTVESTLIPPVESPHPYPQNADIWIPVFAPMGVDWVSVHFVKIDVESGYDYVTIYDQFMNPVGYYSGYYEDIWTSPVTGSMLWIRLQSDYIYEYWGFLADAYRYGNIPPLKMHEIGLGATWENYVIANSTFTISVDVQNFGDFTEEVMLNMTFIDGMGGIVIDNWNFENVTVAPGETTTVEVTPEVILNATTQCSFAGIHGYGAIIFGMIYNSSSGTPPYQEIDYSNNIFMNRVSAVPKTERSGLNPLVSIMTPKKITSISAPLIAMYPKDFALHNITAFVSGGKLVNAKFEITGDIMQIASFVDVEEFTYHARINTPTETLPDPSPAYFIPNTAATIGDTLDLGNVTAPIMLSAELQVYIDEDTMLGLYTGMVQLVNDSTVLASSSLSFEVKTPKYKVLWEDYYNDYEDYWENCERLWGGSNWGLGVFKWWELASQAGFDVDSLHQKAYFERHVGMLGVDTLDPLGIIAFGGYDALYMHDCDFSFRPSEISVFRQLYETGKMDFAVLFDEGSEALANFTSYYGIETSVPVYDLVIEKFDKTHPIFNGVNNFTLFIGPMLKIGTSVADSMTRGIAVGSDDFGAYYEGGFVVVVNEMHATSHLTSRMVAVSDSDTFECLEYGELMLWLYSWIFTGEGVVAKVDTNKFAVNLLRWLDPQFANEPPIVDYFDATPTTAKLGETVSVDTVVHDPEGDSFNVMIAVLKPDSSWNNATVTPIGGHWLRSFNADLEGIYDVYVIATDSYGAKTEMHGGTVEAVNMPPEIVSASISPTIVTEGEMVFISLNTKDTEDGVPASIRISVITPSGLSHNYNFTNVLFATVNFNTSSVATGIYTVNVTVQDSNAAQTSAQIGLFEVQAAINHAPTVMSHSISPSKVTVGEAVFITVGCADVEDDVPTNITLTVTAPAGATTTQTFMNMAFASLAFNTGNKPTGIYQVAVTAEDSQGALTTAIIGNFEVEPVPPAGFPMREATLAVGIAGLIFLIIAVLLLLTRLPGKPKPTPS